MYGPEALELSPSSKLTSLVTPQPKMHSPAGSCQMAAALAQAARAPIAVLGRVSLKDASFYDIGIGAARDVEKSAAECALAEIARTIVGTIGFRKAPDRGEASDVDFTVDGPHGGAIAWLTSERCLVGVWRKLSGVMPFVGLVMDRPMRGFQASHRNAARMALIHETERTARRGDPEATDAVPGMTEAILRRVRVGLAVVDCAGRIVQSNAIADNWLQEHDAVCKIDGRLTAHRSDVREQLRTALRDATTGVPRRAGVVALPQSDISRLPSLVTLAPLDASTSRALMVCGSPSCDGSGYLLVLEALGLTHAERRLARYLLTGESVEEAAAHANVKESTARSYVKRIFGKLGVRRQSEFVAYVLALTPPILLDSSEDPVAAPVREVRQLTGRGR